MKNRFIPQEAIDQQARASNPGNSAWVSANAGSGKTHVLSQRVIRLLLHGADPSKILCLTYTRAAAANMSNRVFTNLSEWTMLPEAELAEHISAIDSAQPDRSMLSRARRLFAEALETPGGLKIQTIHAFCESVLHQFPLEANIAAHFEILDPRMEAKLFATARREMLTSSAANPELAAAIAIVLERGGETGLDMLLSEIVAKRDSLRVFIGQVMDVAWPFGALYEEFGFVRDDSAESIAASIWPLPGFEPEFFNALATMADATDAHSVLKNILPSAKLAYVEIDPIKRLGLLVDAFLKADGNPYTASIFKKALLDRLPDLPERYQVMSEALICVADRLAHFLMLEATRASLTIADWLLSSYERLKTSRGFLDFNDLITRTINLLVCPDAGLWVQYKLDKGIDHILLDEAQDTSPDQWEVVKRLTEEFFSGAGARNQVHRTIFAVGDEKQSIYSFQGAEPESFNDSKHAFDARIHATEGRFEDVTLTWSFRSTDDVLSAVERVFEDPKVRRGVTYAPELRSHKAIRAGDPGYVEVWPSVGEDIINEPDDWRKPIDHAHAPAVIVAEQVAATIRKWLDDSEVIEGTGRRLCAGDIMVLVRKRDRFVHALSHALKRNDISVACADRLSLTDHIAVKDLIALGCFLIQPEDDLSLAAILRSPIFGLTEDALFALASGRPGNISLIAALRAAAETDAVLKPVVEQLDAWATEAVFRPIFEFYSGVLSGGRDRNGVRRRMISHLGQEAGDILDEFLNFCLAEERAGLPGLEAFLSTLTHVRPEIKREVDQTRDEIHIMTVHAAKGLEATVVFLVDSGSAPFHDQHLPCLMPFLPLTRRWHGKGYLWRADADVANSFSKSVALTARARADDEYRRLLYVGMTRAKDRLIVCGYHGKRAPGSNTWHSTVSQALLAAPESELRDHPVVADLHVHRFRVTPLSGAVELAPENEATGFFAPTPLPEELFDYPPPYEELNPPLSPSIASALIEETQEAVISDRSPVLYAAVEPVFAIARGSALHHLLELLPQLDPDQRHTAAERYLAYAGKDWDDAQRCSALASVFSILDDTRFSPLFSPTSYAEVSILGNIDVRGKQHSVSGKIDRLVVTENEVLIVDYKTNSSSPTALDEVPNAYIMQLALYRTLFKPLYPDKTVSAALLFIEAPRLIVLPTAILDDASERLTQARNTTTA